MPSKPPTLHRRKADPKQTGWSDRASRQSRGYGREHERMRALVLDEEPLCCTCKGAGRSIPATIADHIVPKAEGGGDERGNYQGLCDPCHKRKTAAESARGRARPART